MKKLTPIIFNIVFFIQVLLIFMLIFEQKVSLPVWMTPFGRMHPLILHFPIAMLVLVGLMQVFRKEFESESFTKIQSFILLFSVLSASLAALMGFFLAQEDGYSGDLLWWHKWTGVGVSVLSYLLLFIQRSGKPVLFNTGLAACIGLLIFAGHFGAGLTHGEDFVWAPLKAETKLISDESTVFEGAIMPILEDKCTSCHNPRKHKGDLIMTDIDGLLKGGGNGALWEEGDAENSLILQRIHLPEEAEEHMPPEGKPQLNETEIKLISSWINDGADLNIFIGELVQEDSLYQLIKKKSSLNTESKKPVYTFESSSEKTIEKLNNPFRTVVPESYSSPALHAHIFVRANYEASSLTDLLEVKNQLVYLNLTNMPIEDDDLTTISQFRELRKLILNGTDITGSTLNELNSCTYLQTLGLSNTEVSPAQIDQLLSSLPKLEEISVWNTLVSGEDTTQILQKYPQLTLNLGYIPDENELLTLSPPILENEKNVLTKEQKVSFKHLFPGVEIRYTLDDTEPDSLESTLYTAPFPIENFTEVKAKAFIEGWLGSRTVTHTFFRKGFSPANAELLHPPNKQYPGEGAEGLFDGEKGDPGNFRTPYWLGYKDNPFVVTMDFGDQPPVISHFTLSYGVNIGSYIMPPVWVEVWGGNQPGNMERLKRINLPVPTDYERNRIGGLDIEFGEADFQYYRIVAKPLTKLPSWHRGSGDKGWVFVDEIFVY